MREIRTPREDGLNVRVELANRREALSTARIMGPYYASKLALCALTEAQWPMAIAVSPEDAQLIEIRFRSSVVAISSVGAEDTIETSDIVDPSSEAA